jgi:hypothetical protein
LVGGGGEGDRAVDEEPRGLAGERRHHQRHDACGRHVELLLDAGAPVARALQDAGVGKSVRIGVLRGSRTIEIDLDVVDIRER